MSKINKQHDTILAQTNFSVSDQSTELASGNIKTQCEINLLLTQCSV
jgi:hypothetical protein